MTASIYTQPFDVEGEQNGLMTYDREVVKTPFEELRKIHGVIIPNPKKIPAVTACMPDLTEPAQIYANSVQQYLNGKKDGAFLKKLTMMAIHNDAAGKSRFCAEYIVTWKKPYSEEDLAFMEGSMKKVTDPAFNILLSRLDDLSGRTKSLAC